MSFDKLQQIVKSLSNEMKDSEKIAIPFLMNKLSKYAKTYPYDQTIGMIQNVMEKMSSSKFYITRKELKDLYSRLYSNDTKFASLFVEELGETIKLGEIKLYERDDAKELPAYMVEDKILLNALNTAFDNTIPLKAYSDDMANKALKSVGGSLDAWNLRPSRLDVSDGNEKFIIIRADYDTPKGVTSFYIPVELLGKKVVEADLFIGNSGPCDLTHTSIKNYLKAFAGSKLKINGKIILKVAIDAKSNKREITDTELALTKLKASRQEKLSLATDQILGFNLEPENVKDVQLPIDHSFEHKFSTPEGVASLNFGEDNVRKASSVLLREILGLGYDAKVKITSSDNNTIFYGVSINNGKTAFTVPVKFSKGKLLSPKMMICNGSLGILSKENIDKLSSKEETDFRVVAMVSPQNDLKSNDLIDNIRKAITSNNHDKAEDALNVLAHSGDDKAYAIGFNIYLNSLASKREDTKTCSLLIKNSSSKYDTCGHTNLPIHKTYIDEQGHCRPLYRRAMNDNYEPGAYINYKIFG